MCYEKKCIRKATHQPYVVFLSPNKPAAPTFLYLNIIAFFIAVDTIAIAYPFCTGALSRG
jgi:hypothetical protein